MRSASIEVTEYDWSKVNGVIYEHNGAVIRSIPAIHFEQTASFILEWNGMKLAFMGDSLPNRWWIEHANGADLAIGECFLPPALAAKKWGFSEQEALNAVTKIHANATFAAKVMAMTKAKHNVAYHFQNDADTLPVVMNAVEQNAEGLDSLIHGRDAGHRVRLRHAHAAPQAGGRVLPDRVGQR